MVVAEPHIVGIAITPPKADTPLIIDADAVPTGAVSAQRLQAIARGHPQECQARGAVDEIELPLGAHGHVARKPFTYRPKESAAVRLSANVLITANRRVPPW